ncbi:FAD dependent oxidoreductase [Pyrenophora seminiperda CCB06]|uniref:FAD dependent oxidoreductase n=1 Tax=Pyrenophora seminiperda CCB06 TaxID=1302712 RepID=A0A3M7MDX5_9PLEO|nr:FAD dependent oxidoreductase [Pyrenophora seminiperda CCB06]
MDIRSRIPVGPPIASPLPSYWQSPSSPLAKTQEPSTDNPTKPFTHIIIGSGISGTMIAFNILKSSPSANIAMLEAREICSGATGRNGGHTKAASYHSYTGHVQDLGKAEALKIARLEYANTVETHALAEELRIDCENTLCNTVDVVFDPDAFEHGKQAIKALQADLSEEERGEGKAAWYKIYEDVEEIRRRFFMAGRNENATVAEKEEVVGAFEYLAGRVHAYRFTTGVLAECVKQGLQLCANTPVHDVRPSIHTDEPGAALWDVFTQHATFTASNVIIATNGYTPYLLKELQGTIVPLRGQITAQKPGTQNKLVSPLPTTYSFIYRTGFEYMIPRPLPDGTQHMIIGGGLGRLPSGGPSEYGTVDDSRLNTQISAYLRETCIGYFGTENWGEQSEEEVEQRVVQEWTGIMGATSDERPFVGEVPGKKGLWMSAGFNGHGMVLCLKSAEALVKMMGKEGMLPEWFPESYLITSERLERCKFQMKTDADSRTSRL